jgi:hypothetical protein
MEEFTLGTFSKIVLISAMFQNLTSRGLEGTTGRAPGVLKTLPVGHPIRFLKDDTNQENS